jgi:hypothetical protein
VTSFVSSAVVTGLEEVVCACPKEQTQKNRRISTLGLKFINNSLSDKNALRKQQKGRGFRHALLH